MLPFKGVPPLITNLYIYLGFREHFIELAFQYLGA